VSHDGKWLVYRTSDASGAFRDIFRSPMSGDRTSQPILTGPTSEITPSLSPDDKWLLYSSDRTGILAAYVRPFEGGSPVKISTGNGSEPVWSRDGHSIFYREGRAIVEATLAGSPPTITSRRTVADGPFIADGGYGDYDVSPDGSHFLMLESADRQAETIIVHNWGAELRRVSR